MNNRNAQNLIEYILIAAMVAIILGLGIASKFDLKIIKNYVFLRPASNENPTQIKIETMTDIK